MTSRSLTPSPARPASAPGGPAGRRQRALAAALPLLVGAALWLGTARLRDEYALRHATLAQLQTLASQRPNDPRALYYLGLRAEDAGRTQLAVDSLLRAARLAPDDEAAWRAWARADTRLLGPAATDQLGQPPAAIILRLFLKDHPRSPGAHTDLARLYLDGGYWQSAYDEAQAATRIDPDDAAAWQIMGAAAQSNREPALAAAAYRQALRCDPADWRSDCGLGEALLKQGRPGEAQAVFQEAARRAPTEALPCLELGKVELQTMHAPAQVEAARQELFRADAGAAALTPEQQYDTRLLLGDSFQQQARWREALTWLRRAEALGPFEPPVHYALAAVYAGLGDAGAAARERARHQQLVSAEQQITVCRDRVTAAPNDPSAHLALARAYARRGEVIQAKQSCWEALARAPGDHGARALLVSLSRRP